MKIHDGIRKFYDYLGNNSHSPLTASAYKFVLSKIPRQNQSLENLNPQDLQNFLSKFSRLSPSSRNLKRSAVRSFVHWCLEMGFLQTDISRSIKFERVPVVEAQYLTPEQIGKFRTAIQGEGFSDCVVGVFASIDYLKPKTGKTMVSYSVRFTPRSSDR